MAETSVRRRMGRGARADTLASDGDDGVAAVADVVEESSRDADEQPSRRFIEPAKMVRCSAGFFSIYFSGLVLGLFSSQGL